MGMAAKMQEKPTIKVGYFEDTDNFKCIYYHNFKGRLHNETGPARIMFYSNGKKRYEEYYLKGKFITYNDKF